MSEKSTTSPLDASNELVRWMQLLVLPTWARVLLIIFIAGAFCGGFWLLIDAIQNKNKDSVGPAITLLTVSLPILLVILGLVFGQNGAEKLQRTTQRFLQIEFPQALLSNLGFDACHPYLEKRIAGCRCEYRLTFAKNCSLQHVHVPFLVELNVKKLNFVVWLPASHHAVEPITHDSFPPLKHVFAGAEQEGYTLNPNLAHSSVNGRSSGLLFARTLEADFLLRPMARLYLAQDLGFFVRGIVEAQSPINLIKDNGK